MTDRIELTGIEVFARHGVFPAEKESAHVFKVDVVVFADLSTAGVSDDLDDTIDYGLLASEIREVVGSETHQLIERVAESVATVALAHDRAERVRVTIHKPDAPVEVALKDVSVTIERSR